MIKIKTSIYAAIFALLLFQIYLPAPLVAQVTIGSNQPPVAGALLELKEDNVTTKGLGLPRVNLTASTGDLATSLGHPAGTFDITEHVGLLVYNLTNDFCLELAKGIHVWTGTKWIPIPDNSRIVSTDAYTGANTYIVPASSSITIPLTRAFRIWQNYASAGAVPTAAEINEGKVLDLASVNNLSGTLSAEVLWQHNGEAATTPIIQTLTIEGTGASASLSLTTTSNLGNALVAVRIGPTGTNADPILWSWQIWVPDEDPTDKRAQKYCFNGNVFMNRNLGAVDNIQLAGATNAYGTYYQWGRKDPFPTASRLAVPPEPIPTFPIVASERANFTASIQSPEKYITNTVGPSLDRDWYSMTHHSWDARWGNLDRKSPFDPCPWGWRVPQVDINGLSPWHDIGGASGPSNNGWVYNQPGKVLGYYPSAGWRDEFHTLLNNRNNGNYAIGVSTTAFTTGGNIFFPGVAATPMAARQRASGLSVRCVAEVAK